ncbi:MAG: hypothetical protein Q4E24_01140 [bacterium]|nr:hypothetical protein [bacterium]
MKEQRVKKKTAERMKDEIVMDERIKEGYRKIYTELLRLIVLADVVSLLVKEFVLKADWHTMITEFAVLIFAPVYLMVRQNMLGIHAEGVMSQGKRRRKLWVMMAVSFACYMAAVLVIKKSLEVSDVAGALSFIAVWLFIYWGAEKINLYFYKRKMRQYEDE